MRKDLKLICRGVLAAAVTIACGPAGQDTSPREAPGVPAPSEQVLERGAKLYATQCQACHGDRSGNGGRPEAPVHNETGHTWHHPDAQLKEWIMNGKFPGAMPAFGGQFTDEDVEVVLAFITTWWTASQRESQADISKRYQQALDEQKSRQ